MTSKINQCARSNGAAAAPIGNLGGRAVTVLGKVAGIAWALLALELVAAWGLALTLGTSAVLSGRVGIGFLVGWLSRRLLATFGKNLKYVWVDGRPLKEVTSNIKERLVAEREIFACGSLCPVESDCEEEYGPSYHRFLDAWKLGTTISQGDGFESAASPLERRGNP